MDINSVNLAVQTVKRQIADPASGIGGELTATYAQPSSHTIIPIGTSVTESGKGPGTNEPLNYSNRGYMAWALSLLEQRLNLIRNAGVSGNTTAQMLARIDADVIAHNPGFCIIEPGPNDASTDVTPAQTLANITAMVDKLKKAGIRPLVATITPASSHTAPRATAARAANKLIRDFARTTRGVDLVDFAAAVTDPATGLWVTNYVEDGVHPAQDGAAVMGTALADALAPLVPPASNVIGYSGDENNLLANGRFNGSAGNYAGLATNWSLVAGDASALTITANKIIPVDGRVGEIQELKIGGGNIGLPRLMPAAVVLPDSRVTTGNTVVGTISFERSDWLVQAALPQYFKLNLIAVGASGEITRSVSLYRLTTEKYLKNWPTYGVLRTPPLTVAADWTSIQLQFEIGGVDTGRFRFEFASIEKGL